MSVKVPLKGIIISEAPGGYFKRRTVELKKEEDKKECDLILDGKQMVFKTNYILPTKNCSVEVVTNTATQLSYGHTFQLYCSTLNKEDFIEKRDRAKDVSEDPNVNTPNHFTCNKLNMVTNSYV